MLSCTLPIGLYTYTYFLFKLHISIDGSQSLTCVSGWISETGRCTKGYNMLLLHATLYGNRDVLVICPVPCQSYQPERRV